jgi:predicted dehydrogenase
VLHAAIVGLGRWGQRLVESVSTPPSAEIRFTHAVVRTPENARAFCARHGIALCADYDAALRDPAVQAVVLATPHSQHAEQIVRAARAGKHVFVEKPFALDAGSAAAAAQAARKAGIVLAPGHNRRFLPALREMQRLVASGALGEVLHVEGAFSGSGALSYPAGGWRASRAESPAGGMTAMGIHIVDAFLWLAGRVAAVRCESQRRVLGVALDDTTSVLFRFESGATGYLSTVAATGRMVRVQVFGSRGWLQFMDHQPVLERADLDGRVTRTEFPTPDIERLELDAFARAVAGTAPYPVPVDDAVHGIAVLEAVIRSAARDGERIVIRTST